MLLEDDVQASRLARSGNETAFERFDWSVVGQEYTHSYQEMVGRDPGCE